MIENIRNIFVPQTIGSYYVYTQRILGIEIHANKIYCTLIKATGRQRIILNTLNYSFNSKDNTTQAITQALNELKNTISFDQVCVVLSSSQVILKDVEVPFIGHTKIKKIIPFEIEADIPFSLDEIVLDSIVIEENKQTQKTKVYVAITKKTYIENYLEPFKQAAIAVDKISVDILELYALFKNSAQQSDKAIQALVEVTQDATKIAVLINGHLSYTRTINKGLLAIAQELPINHESNVQDRLAYLFNAIDLAVNKQENITIKQLFTELINDIHFTIKNYLSRHAADKTLDALVLMGSLIDIFGIQQLFEQITNVPCYLFTVHKLITSGQIQANITNINNNYLPTIATALALPITKEFNLQQLHAQQKEEQIIYNQLRALIIIASIILFGFSVHSFFKLRYLKSQLTEHEHHAITKLKRSFNLKRSANTSTVTNAIKAAKKELLEQETAWQRLSVQNRTALLRYLITLSKCINTKESGLEVSQITINLAEQEEPDTIQLFGQVNTYAQLNKLQNQLACPLFEKIPKLQDLNFKQDPIILTVKQEEL